MVEGVSGGPERRERRRHRVKREPSIGRLRWTNGSEAQLFSGDNPDGFAPWSMISPGALQLLDCIVAAAIEEPARNDPPLSSSAGQTYLIGTSPTGEWSDYPDHLAAFGAGGWRFVVPVVGLRVIEKSSGTVAAYGAAGWEMGVVRASRIIVDGQQVVGPQGGAIADPAGGTTVDLEARSTITEILSALRQHGLISG